MFQSDAVSAAVYSVNVPMMVNSIHPRPRRPLVSLGSSLGRHGVYLRNQICVEVLRYYNTYYLTGA